MLSDPPYYYEGYPRGLKYPWIYPRSSEKERNRRWSRIRLSMEEHNIDCLIIPGDNSDYLKGSRYLSYVSNYIPFVGTAFVVFPREGRPLLSVSTFLGPQFMHCAKEVSWIEDVVGVPDQTESLVRKIKQLGLERGRLGIIGYEEMKIPALVYNGLKDRLPDVTFEYVTYLMSGIVDASSEDELAMLRKAAELCDLSFNAVMRLARPGVKEYELWAAAVEAITANGGIYPPSIYATSARRPLFPRLPPSHRALALSDIVIFELKANYGGYMPQICFAIALGRPKKKIGLMFDFCSELYKFAVAEIKKNKVYSEVENELIRRILVAGYRPMTPQIHVNDLMPCSKRPKPGDYITVHPNVVDKDYTAGAKSGNTVLIGKDGDVEYLMKTPHKLNIVHQDE